DNGPHREGGHNPDYWNSNGIFRGIKRDLYDGGTRVPMIATWPGTIEAGSESDHISAFWDFFSTAAEISGRKLDTKTDGISYLPTLMGKGKQREHEYLYWEFHARKGRVAIRKGDWKGVRYDVAKNPDSTLELYNLKDDPGESNNLAAQHPELVAELDNLIRQSRVESPNPRFNFPK
ncbi:MAG: sulfatase/phosphatase domain-containing protein, partial [Verrucomicrobiota bacterium]